MKAERSSTLLRCETIFPVFFLTFAWVLLHVRYRSRTGGWGLGTGDASGIRNHRAHSSKSLLLPVAAAAAS
jgi:hypothetical protein